MEISCLLNYPPVIIPSLFPRQKDKFQQISNFSFPLLKKNGTKIITPLHLNAHSNPTTETLSDCQPKSINGTICEHLVNGNEGIGILSFFKGKNILITGATGFLGKGDAFLVSFTNFLIYFFYFFRKKYYEYTIINTVVYTGFYYT